MSADATQLWLTTRDCMAFIPCKSLSSTYMWLKRHGIVRRNNGSVSRRDLERELARRKPRRVMNPASLRNLKHTSINDVQSGFEQQTTEARTSAARDSR